MKRLGLGAAVLVAAMVAGCGSSHVATQTTTVISVKAITTVKKQTQTASAPTSASSAPSCSKSAINGCLPTNAGCPHGMTNAYAASRYAPCETAATANSDSTATQALNCDQSGRPGTLVGGDVCQYELAGQEVIGPSGAYLTSFFDNSVCDGGTADWSNGQHTTVPAQDPSAPQCSGQ